MSSVNQAFKYNQHRKNVILGGSVILICITLLSCVSSFMIYREGFVDLPSAFQVTLSFFAVIVVEGHSSGWYMDLREHLHRCLKDSLPLEEWDFWLLSCLSTSSPIS